MDPTQLAATVITPIELEILFGVCAALASTGLGLFILFRNPKSATNILFFILAVLIDIYIIINFFSLHPPGGEGASQLYWIRLVMFICSFIGPVLVFFSHTFPRKHFTMTPGYYVPIYMLMALSAFLALTPLVFSGIEYPGGEPVPTPGPGIIVFILDFVGLFILSFVILWRKLLKAKGEERDRIRLLLTGSLFSFSLMGLSTVLSVAILKTSAFVFLGPIFPVILMGAIAYAIATREFLGQKVAAAEVIVGVLWIVLAARIFIAESQIEILIDSGIFLFAILFGFLLVRSVQAEIRQRKEIEHLADGLEQANMRLKELDKRKSEFVSISSHQLRTPLTAIKGYASLLLEESYGVMGKEVRETVQKIYDSSTLMAVTINDFLDVARIEQGKMIYDITEFDLRKLAQDTVVEFTPIVEHKGLKIMWAPASDVCMVKADAGKVRQVLNNLLDNSIRYTQKGMISVSVHCEEKMAHLSVNDTGIGMSKSVQTALFEKFMRAENASKEVVNGTGLGLFVNKQMVEAMHGRIWAESPGEGEGSTFHVELPKA